MKTAVVYSSKHHGNTKKVLDAICEKHDVMLINAMKFESADLLEYNVIGFASGIYYSKFHKSVLKLAEKNFPKNKRVFLLYTYAAPKEGYTKAIKDVVTAKSVEILGEFGCLGFNTFGPFKLIGGIAKGHPDKTELENAVKFFEGITV